MDFGRATLGFADEDQDGQGDQNPGNGRDIERGPPAVAGSQHLTGEVPEGCSYGDGNVKHGEDSVAVFGRVVVGEQCWGEDAQARFGDTEDRVAQYE